MLKYTIVFFIAMLFFSIDDAYAYVDPGRGSGLQQLLANGFSGLAAVIGAFFRSLLGRKKSDD